VGFTVFGRLGILRPQEQYKKVLKFTLFHFKNDCKNNFFNSSDIKSKQRNLIFNHKYMPKNGKENF